VRSKYFMLTKFVPHTAVTHSSERCTKIIERLRMVGLLSGDGDTDDAPPGQPDNSTTGWSVLAQRNGAGAVWG
jgi:hypothetical protein